MSVSYECCLEIVYSQTQLCHVGVFNGLRSYYMHCARTHGVEISTLNTPHVTQLCLTMYYFQVSHTQRG